MSTEIEKLAVILDRIIRINEKVVMILEESMKPKIVMGNETQKATEELLSSLREKK